jgi:uncharacterized membrane protein
MYSSPNERETMRKAKKSLLVTLLTTCLIGGSIGAAVAGGLLGTIVLGPIFGAVLATAAGYTAAKGFEQMPNVQQSMKTIGKHSFVGLVKIRINLSGTQRTCQLTHICGLYM